LFEMQVNSFAPLALIVAIEFSGIPHNPNPPNMTVMPSEIPLIASSALLTTLFNAILNRQINSSLHLSQMDLVAHRRGRNRNYSFSCSQAHRKAAELC
jgi:hypothetical protein